MLALLTLLKDFVTWHLAKFLRFRLTTLVWSWDNTPLPQDPKHRILPTHCLGVFPFLVTDLAHMDSIRGGRILDTCPPTQLLFKEGNGRIIHHGQIISSIKML